MMNLSENSSFTPSSLLLQYCTNIFISISWIRFILLLPLSTAVLYLGLQKWLQQRSFKTASHFDIFTYHLVAMEFLWVLGYLCQVCAHNYSSEILKYITQLLTFNALCGEILFHTLICVERYIAVVLPITYMRIRASSGVRVRTISIVFVWLLSLGVTSFKFVRYSISNIPLLCLLGFAITVSSFCSLSVLCALIRPGPGESNKENGLVDRSKQRAFHIITVISGLQWLWFLSLLSSTAILQSSLLNFAAACVLGVSVGFCNLPYCLVIPLIYLHRTAKLSQK